MIDTEMGGVAEATGCFLLAGNERILVEAGPGVSANRVAAALHIVGVTPADLRWIIVTHVHLDHAGAAGELARRFPAATVLVHPRGARHLVDPTRLMASARRIHGPRLDTLYGGMTPLHPSRLRTVEDGERLALGDRVMEFRHTPGHARHHIAVLDRTTSTLFTGDAAGVKLGGMRTIRPSTPPPDFDKDTAVASLRAMKTLKPDRVVFTHFGPVDPPLRRLDEAEERLHRWCAVAEATVRASGPDVGRVRAALVKSFAREEGLLTADPGRFDVFGGYGASAAGMVHWLNRR